MRLLHPSILQIPNCNPGGFPCLLCHLREVSALLCAPLPSSGKRELWKSAPQGGEDEVGCSEQSMDHAGVQWGLKTYRCVVLPEGGWGWLGEEGRVMAGM